MNVSLFAFVIFLAVGIGIAVVPLFLSWFVWQHKKHKQPTKELLQPEVHDEVPWLRPKDYADYQGDPYESGMPSLGPWRTIGYEYIVYAILFLLFDTIFIVMFFGLGAWLRAPKLVALVILAVAALSGLMIAYALKQRKYLRL